MDRKRNRGLKRRWEGKRVRLLGAGGGGVGGMWHRGRDPSSRHGSHMEGALPFMTWIWDLGSPSREASRPGDCILDSLSFMPLMLPCSPQALQSLGRLSSWLASKELSGVSRGQNATCNGPIMFRRVWRRQAPYSRAPALPLLGNYCGLAAPHTCLVSRNKGSQMWERNRDTEARLPTVSYWVVLYFDIRPPTLSVIVSFSVCFKFVFKF